MINKADLLRERDMFQRQKEEAEAENATLKRRIAELEAARQPTDAVATKTLRIAEKP